MSALRVLLRYHYFQPVDGRFLYRGHSVEPPSSTFSLIYSGVIPSGEEESTEEILERLLLRHSAALRPHSREFRPIGAGDLLEVSGRGTWQVLPSGFRSMNVEALAAGAPN